MDNIVIKAENVSKLYRLGQVGTGSFAHDLNRWWARIRGKEDPYLKIGVTNDRTTKGDSEYVWALQNIDFEVKQGEALGIIGRNGAGKSTLLKILSRTTTPTTGSLKAKGRIASLLEVGTGFHPDLSGKENIFLNGAILGMNKSEIRSKFDEIVAFAGVERYINTPVKRYSSGMYVRLAFAVAAHLESEILILDEVLAVGDSEFQKKCLGKMSDVAKAGRTVIFVSHNLGAIRSLCTKALLMSNGQVKDQGNVESIINSYLSHQLAKSKIEFDPKDKDASNEFAQIISIEMIAKETNGTFWITEEVTFKIIFINKSIKGPINVNLFFNTEEGINIFATCSQQEALPLGMIEAKCIIPEKFFNDNNYYIDLMVVESGQVPRLFLRDAIVVEGKEPPRAGGWLDKFPGMVRPSFNWNFNINKNNE